MEEIRRDELEQALKAVLSIHSKCEKALLGQRLGSPQHTLLVRRIAAMALAARLIKEKLEELGDGAAP